MTVPVALFPRLLGQDWHALALPVQRMHGQDPCVHARGTVQVDGARHWPARALRRLLGLPGPSPVQVLHLTIERRAGQEAWTRHFDAGVMRSTLSCSRDGERLHERLGPITLGFALRREGEAIDWQLLGGHLFGMPLPRSWLGAVHSRSGAAAGRYAFDIETRLPLLGELVSYRGWLEPVDG